MKGEKMCKEKVILLVEDNPDDELLALRALRKNNIHNKIVIARDGQEAIDYLFKAAEYSNPDLMEKPQLILLDLKLPKIDGLEVLRHIRSHDSTKYIPVAILTSSKEDKDIIESYKLGANSYIRKPVDFNQFSESVRQLGLYWLVLNETPPEIIKE